MILYINILFILCNINNLKPHTSVWRTLKKSRNPVQIESALTSRFSILTEFEWSPRSDEFSYDYEILHFDHKTPCKCHVIILFQIKQFSTHHICVWNKSYYFWTGVYMQSSIPGHSSPEKYTTPVDAKSYAIQTSSLPAILEFIAYISRMPLRPIYNETCNNLVYPFDKTSDGLLVQFLSQIYTHIAPRHTVIFNDSYQSKSWIIIAKYFRREAWSTLH